MTSTLSSRIGTALDHVSPPAAARARRLKYRASGHDLRQRVADLERDVVELRQLSRRLADTLAVVGELLVPALDRDDDRVRDALERLT